MPGHSRDVRSMKNVLSSTEIEHVLLTSSRGNLPSSRPFCLYSNWFDEDVTLQRTSNRSATWNEQPIHFRKFAFIKMQSTRWNTSHKQYDNIFEAAIRTVRLFHGTWKTACLSDKLMLKQMRGKAGGTSLQPVMIKYKQLWYKSCSHLAQSYSCGWKKGFYRMGLRITSIVSVE